MNFSRFTMLAALIGTAASISLQAAVKDLPTKKVNGNLYHYYEVTSKETVYSLCYKLDTTKEEIIRHNPAVADGLRKGMVLFFPVEESQPAKAEPAAPAHAAAEQVISHHVSRGETIFGIARKYGLSTEDVIAQNPVLKNGLKAGQTIKLTIHGSKADIAASTPHTEAEESKNSAETATAIPAQEMRGYVVKKKETFYSIAVENGISVAALEAANPGITTLKEGQVLNIPYVPEKSDRTDMADVPATPARTDDGQDSETGYETAETDETAASETAVTVESREPVSIAVLLPFMLNEETPSKSAMRYTEFYKGFLLAVDSLRNNGTPIHVTAYDTEGSVLKIREALMDTAFRKHNAIIAPDNAAQLAILAEYGKNNNVKVFNTFLVRDDSYLTNKAVMQSNLPSALMYRKAADALMERLSYSTPVFLSFKGESGGDKAEFVAALKQSLSAKGNTFMDIEIEGRLNGGDLRALPTDGNYTFIPTSSRQADLNRLMPGIIEWRDEAVTPMVRMFGYPEWTTFRGETLENMHNLNTTVYSRFYTHEESPRTLDIDARYKKWYGNSMENAVPRQGLLGFDTGMFVIPYLLHSTSGYDGVQNGYFFTSAGGDGSGAYNDALYFINFRPGNVIEKTRI